MDSFAIATCVERSAPGNVGCLSDPFVAGCFLLRCRRLQYEPQAPLAEGPAFQYHLASKLALLR